MPLEFDGVNSKVSADKIQGQTGTTVTIESGHSLSGSGASLTNLPAANLIGTLPAIDGSNLTGVDPTKTAVEALGIELPAANLTGSIAGARLPDPLPAISGASLTGLPAGGEKRNFIIDGDFTQWPEGDRTSIAHGAYGPALWRHWSNGPSAVKDIKKSTDVPTVAQSGHQSAYSVHIDVTTADAAVAASDTCRFGFKITGSDFAHLHQQQVTLAFWVKDTKTGPHAVSFANNAVDRCYVAEYTINTTNTWEYKTITLTLDTSGTWLFTEDDIGMFIFFGLMVGTDAHATADTWTTRAYGTSSTVNSLDSASNNFYLSQVGLYLGSTAPTFSSPPIAIVQSQVDYYVENISGYIGSGWANTSNAGLGVCHWTTKRKAPTVTYIDQTSFYIETSASGGNATTMGMYLAQERSGRWSWARSGASHTTGHGAVVRADGTGRLLVDARH